MPAPFFLSVPDCMYRAELTAQSTPCTETFIDTNLAFKCVKCRTTDLSDTFLATYTCICIYMHTSGRLRNGYTWRFENNCLHTRFCCNTRNCLYRCFMLKWIDRLYCLKTNSFKIPTISILFTISPIIVCPVPGCGWCPVIAVVELSRTINVISA